MSRQRAGRRHVWLALLAVVAPWLGADAAQGVDLNVTIAEGRGTVTADVGRVLCPPRCDAFGVDPARIVTLEAEPAPGSVFVQWSRCNDGRVFTTTCYLTGGGLVEVRFSNKRKIVLTVGPGRGSVRSEPTGLTCAPQGDGTPRTCEGEVPIHGRETFVATVPTGWTTASPTSPPRPANTLTVWGPGSGCVSSLGDPLRCTIDPTQADRNQSYVGIAFRPIPVVHLLAIGPGSIAVRTPGVGKDDGQAGPAVCGPGYCELSYETGQDVVFEAVPQPGRRFAGWSDPACGATNVCRRRVDWDYISLAALFNPATLVLSGSFAESLRQLPAVTSEPSDIGCPVSTVGAVTGSCTAEFDLGSLVTLSALSGPGIPLARFPYGCPDLAPSGTGQRCNVVVASDPTWVGVNIGGEADPGAPTSAQLQLAVSREGEGRIVGQRLDCGGKCHELYVIGTGEMLTAMPSTGWRFDSWIGPGQACGKVNPCSVRAGLVTALTARFVRIGNPPQPPIAVTGGEDGTSLGRPPDARRLSLRTSGSGAGVLRYVGGACPPSCAVDTSAASLVVTALARPGSRFIAWNGAGCGKRPRCETGISESVRTLTARFDRLPAIVTLIGVSQARLGGRRVVAVRVACPSGARIRLSLLAGSRRLVSVSKTTTGARTVVTIPAPKRPGIYSVRVAVRLSTGTLVTRRAALHIRPAPTSRPFERLVSLLGRALSPAADP
jgi:hypothetical protein